MRARSPAMTRHGAGGEGERDALCLGLRASGLDALRGDRAQIERRPRGRACRPRPGEEEQVADEVEEPVRVALDDAQEPALLVGQVAGLAVEQELGVAPDRRQRRAQLVRDERDELVLQPVELAQALVLGREVALRGLGEGARLLLGGEEPRAVGLGLARAR